VLVDWYGIGLDAGAATREEEAAEREARIPLIAAFVEAGVPVDYAAVAWARSAADPCRC
jgi:hypothetical protein